MISFAMRSSACLTDATFAAHLCGMNTDGSTELASLSNSVATVLAKLPSIKLDARVFKITFMVICVDRILSGSVVDVTMQAFSNKSAYAWGLATLDNSRTHSIHFVGTA